MIGSILLWLLATAYITATDYDTETLAWPLAALRNLLWPVFALYMIVITIYGWIKRK